MASFVAKRVVKHVLVDALGCSELRAEKLGNIAKWGTAIATADIAGLLADRAIHEIENAYHHLCEGEKGQHYDSEGEEDDVEEEGIVKHGHHIENLAYIQPYLKMASAAYKDTEMAKELAFVKRSQLIHDLKVPTKLHLGIETDTKVHVCVLDDGTLVFAFRGTVPFDWKHPLSNIFVDLMQNQVPLEHYFASGKATYKAPSSVKVHKGFLLAFQDVTKTSSPEENLRLVAEGLGVREGDVKRVVCTGHSLGGALATLCAHWCRYVGYKNADIWCVTTGSPRVGNHAFAKDFNENVTRIKKHSYRVVNKGDLVPAMPHLITYPKIWAAYKHVDGLVYLSEHPTKKDLIILKRGGRRPHIVFLTGQDHSCNAYFQSIQVVLASFYNTHGSHCIPTT